MNDNIIVRTGKLVKNFKAANKQTVKALSGISLDIYRNETVGLVGESGCGKSTFGRSILRLIEPTSGSVLFNNEELLDKSPSQIREMRKYMQLIFQDAYSSLNPRMTIYELMCAPLNNYKIGDKKQRNEKVKEIMNLVGLDLGMLDRYPHEFSGGQLQRIAIASTLILDPQFVVCDEPVSALDVSVRSQVLNLMQDLKQRLNLTYLFISHDLSVVRYFCDRIGVMYLGQIVEIADKKEFFANPIHPYTQALLSVIPNPDPTVKISDVVLKGEIPSAINPPKGCPFHPRCNYARPECSESAPEFKDIGNGHFVSCHLCKGICKES